MASDIDKALLSVVIGSVRSVLSELKAHGYELRTKDVDDVKHSGQYGTFIEEGLSGRVFRDVSGELRVYVLEAGYRDRWVVVEEGVTSGLLDVKMLSSVQIRRGYGFDV